MTDARDGILRKLLRKIASEQGYENPHIETAVVATTGSNFTSQLFHATIKSEGKKDIHAFAKVSVIGEALREVSGEIFDMEPQFYIKIAKKFQEIEEKHEVPEEHRLIIPKFYGYSDDYLEEIMVLQDLSKDGFVTFDRMKSYDWAYASKAVEELAKFHALSIAFHTEYPTYYKEVTDVFNSKSEMFDETGPMSKMFENSIENTLQMTRPENKEKMKKFYDVYDVKRFAKFFTPKKRPVLTHNDFRQSNLLYKVEEAPCFKYAHKAFTRKNGKLQLVILDYQTVHQGCALTDLMTFIFTGSDGAFRAKYFDKLIEHYYKNLAKALWRLDLDPEEAFPRKDFDEELKETMPFGLLMACMTLPVITIDLDSIPKTKDDDFVFDNLEVMTSMMGKGNAECHRRVNETIDDFVKWGILQ